MLPLSHAGGRTEPAKVAIDLIRAMRAAVVPGLIRRRKHWRISSETLDDLFGFINDGFDLDLGQSPVSIVTHGSHHLPRLVRSPMEEPVPPRRGEFLTFVQMENHSTVTIDEIHGTNQYATGI